MIVYIWLKTLLVCPILYANKKGASQNVIFETEGTIFKNDKKYMLFDKKNKFDN